MIPLRLSELVRRSAPRYTSYPTAPQFGPSVGPREHGAWLRELAGTSAPISLYLHVPFCRSICHYCACTTKATRRDEPIVAYADRLRREIELVADRAGRLPVSHIHWGGGTPNLLPPDIFDGLVGDLRERFDVRPDAEHAIELDPRWVTREGARRLKASGVTRASLGVQDFDAAVQHAIGRPQPFETVRSGTEALRAAGVAALNFDLMYGLPQQTMRSVRATAQLAASLGPDRIALFGYAHVPWFRANQRLIEEAALPDPSARLDLAETAREALQAEGYAPVGIDHFAKPDDALHCAARDGGLRRNFQGYTTDRSQILIGMGPSAVGKLPQGYVQNASDVAAWSRAIDSSGLGTAKGVALTAEDRARAAVIEAIMCGFETDLAQAARTYGLDPRIFVDDLAKLASLVDQEFVRIQGWKVEILRDGPALARIVASAFDAYLGAGARHSLAL
ncbi:oxygen-independent coproporphyrinogen III oxidase [Chelatococcus sambhunathii]|uniref:Coproporphyrinogen-III oxidase n=1 Tax=Chelatococcus sambhunathii TaxID=363953 RepID=A0ABU1DGC7_9HYPH|nr:oxygen-independent coproporphyrinogen III oxidase [Chelatococcus sambhunathii]MDR4307147.1 oxygen-independent coproporphyrinogen III oxidase [Chelatococcus sambhunathii]